MVTMRGIERNRPLQIGLLGNDFIADRPMVETFRDGVAIVELLMALYRSAETGSTVRLADKDLETYIPPVARGEHHG